MHRRNQIAPGESDPKSEWFQRCKSSVQQSLLRTSTHRARTVRTREQVDGSARRWICSYRVSRTKRNSATDRCARAAAFMVLLRIAFEFFADNGRILVPRGGLRMGFAQLVLSPGSGGSGDARGRGEEGRGAGGRWRLANPRIIWAEPINNLLSQRYI